MPPHTRFSCAAALLACLIGLTGLLTARRHKP